MHAKPGKVVQKIWSQFKLTPENALDNCSCKMICLLQLFLQVSRNLDVYSCRGGTYIWQWHVMVTMRWMMIADWLIVSVFGKQTHLKWQPFLWNICSQKPSLWSHSCSLWPRKHRCENSQLMLACLTSMPAKYSPCAEDQKKEKVKVLGAQKVISETDQLLSPLRWCAIW